MITFKYNGKIYKPSNLENKLKKLGITINDIEIIDDTQTKAEKIQEEKEANKLELPHFISVYWDTKCKGWLEFKNTDNMPEWINEDIKSGRFIYIGECKEAELFDFKKEHFYNIISKQTFC